MPDRWREDEDWRWREGRGGEESYGGRRFGEGDYGRRMQERDYPRYGYGADEGRSYGGGRYAYGPRDMERERFRGAPYGQDYRSQDYRSRGQEGRGWGEGRHEGGGERGWMEKATDEVSSWFGDDDAERRRRMDQQVEQRRGGHYGRGPRGYTRSDERITEDINDRLTDDWSVDASDIEVSVSGGEVTLSGEVESREAKRRAEDIAEAVSGVSNVQNNLRIKAAGMERGSERTGMAGSTTTTGMGQGTQPTRSH